jgi:hypothetical protein
LNDDELSSDIGTGPFRLNSPEIVPVERVWWRALPHPISSAVITVAFAYDMPWSLLAWYVWPMLIAVFFASNLAIKVAVFLTRVWARKRVRSNRVLSDVYPDPEPTSVDGFHLQPDSPEWLRIHDVIVEAIEIDSTSKRARRALHTLIAATLLSILPDQSKYTTKAEFEKEYEVESLPSKYKLLLDYPLPLGTEGETFRQVFSPNLLYEFEVLEDRRDQLLSEKQHTPFFLALACVLLLWLWPNDRAGDSFVANQLLDWCDRTSLPCAQTADGHNKVDALVAAEQFLRTHVPTELPDHLTLQPDESCWTYIGNDLEERVEFIADSRPYFQVVYGEDEVSGYDPEFGESYEFYERSRWNVVPPKTNNDNWIIYYFDPPKFWHYNEEKGFGRFEPVHGFDCH